jgi:predicted ATPase
MRKIVLTGGPWSGKSTLAARLSERGCAVAPEAAIRVIEALREELGEAPALRWRESHAQSFQLRIALLQQELEAEAVGRGATVVVCDRGLPDGIAYLRLRGLEVPVELTAAARRVRYDQVLLLDTLRDFRPRPDTGRIDDRADSLQLRELLEAIYREHGHDPLPVPELPLEERLEHVWALLDL